MPTYTAMTITPNGGSARALEAALEALDDAPYGTGVFEIEDGSGQWEIGAYFTDKPDAVALDLLAAANGARAFTVSEVPDIDWVAHVKRQLAPVTAGRFFVYGSHDADKVPENCEPLLIEAAMAFGTGHHGTTQGCLLAFEKLLGEGRSPDSVADVGCGTAVLAMAAARVLPDATVIASDIDPVAVDVARENCAANGLIDRIECVEAAGFDNAALDKAGPYDLVFANILKAPLIALAPDMAAHVKPGGFAILSGILHDQAADVVEAYGANSLVFKDRFEIGDWTTLLIGRK